jgi:hypothetical protein
MLAASARWGEGVCGNEFITYPVCKRKYQPTKTEGGVVQLLFACHLHDAERGKNIERCGPYESRSLSCTLFVLFGI